LYPDIPDIQVTTPGVLKSKATIPTWCQEINWSRRNRTTDIKRN